MELQRRPLLVLKAEEQLQRQEVRPQINKGEIMNVMELIKFVQSHLPEGPAQVRALAALSDAPSEDFVPTIRLPVQNSVPAFKLGNEGLGSLLANLNYGVAAPVIGQEVAKTPDLGQLLVGERNGSS